MMLPYIICETRRVFQKPLFDRPQTVPDPQQIQMLRVNAHILPAQPLTGENLALPGPVSFLHKRTKCAVLGSTDPVKRQVNCSGIISIPLHLQGRISGRHMIFQPRILFGFIQKCTSVPCKKICTLQAVKCLRILVTIIIIQNFDMFPLLPAPVIY